MLAPITVYRVARHTSILDGIYCSGRCRARDSMEGGRYNHPTPELDEGLKGYWLDLPSYAITRHLFGFGSLDQLKDWIHEREWQRLFKEDGFVIYHLKVEAGLVGEAQAIFQKDLGYTVVETICFSQL